MEITFINHNARILSLQNSTHKYGVTFQECFIRMTQVDFHFFEKGKRELKFFLTECVSPLDNVDTPICSMKFVLNLRL